MTQGAAALVQQAHVAMTPSQSIVRLTATGSVSRFLADRGERLSGMAASHAVELSVSTMKVPLDMAAREADIALRMKKLPESGPLFGRRVANVAFSVYASTKLVHTDSLSSWQGLRIVGLPDHD